MKRWVRMKIDKLIETLEGYKKDGYEFIASGEQSECKVSGGIRIKLFNCPYCNGDDMGKSILVKDLYIGTR